MSLLAASVAFTAPASAAPQYPQANSAGPELMKIADSELIREVARAMALRAFPRAASSATR